MASPTPVTTAVETQIARALGMPHTTWCDQDLSISKLFVHLIRLRRRDNDPNVLGMLTYQFLERVKPIVDHWSRGYGTADSEEIQITVANELGDLLNQAPPSRTAEYLEIDAATIVKQATLRAIGRDRPKAEPFNRRIAMKTANMCQTVERLASEGSRPRRAIARKGRGGGWRRTEVSQRRDRSAAPRPKPQTPNPKPQTPNPFYKVSHKRKFIGQYPCLFLCSSSS